MPDMFSFQSDTIIGYFQTIRSWDSIRSCMRVGDREREGGRESEGETITATNYRVPSGINTWQDSTV